MEKDNTQSINSGITYDHNSTPQTIFYVKKYFEDFKKAFYKYYAKLQTDSNVFAKFVTAHTNAKSSLIKGMGANFSSAVSGGWTGGVYKGRAAL